jgi:integrase
MAKALTSDSQITRLKATDKRQRRALHSPTGSGLYIVVHPGGSKAIIGRYHIDGKPVDVTLGEHGLLKLAEAQARHLEGCKLADLGRDPRQVWAAQYQANVKALTAAEFFPEWLAFYARTPSNKTKRLPAAKTVKEHQARWDRSLVWLHKMPLSEITRELVIRRLKKLSESAPVEARLCLSLLNGMFDAAEDDGHMPVNPVAGLKAAKVGGTAAAKRDRFLKVGEVKAFWLALESRQEAKKVGPQIVAAFKLLLLTGARRSEVAGMAWAEVDMQAGTWLLPAGRSKSFKPYLFHLGPLALSVLGSMAAVRQGDYVFAGAASGHVHPDSLNTSLGRLLNDEAKAMQSFSIHDLRRTAATGWRDHCGADEALADLMLNHAMGDLASRYIIGQDGGGRHMAVRLQWDALLMATMEGTELETNVVRINKN